MNVQSCVLNSCVYVCVCVCVCGGGGGGGVHCFILKTTIVVIPSNYQALICMHQALQLLLYHNKTFVCVHIKEALDQKSAEKQCFFYL